MFASDKDPRRQGQIRTRAVIDDIDFPVWQRQVRHEATSLETSDLVQDNPSRDVLSQSANLGIVKHQNQCPYLNFVVPQRCSTCILWRWRQNSNKG